MQGEKENRVTYNTFYVSWHEAMSGLTDEQYGRLSRALNEYCFSGAKPELEGVEKIIFTMAAANINASNKKKADGKKGGENAKGKSGAPIGNQNAGGKSGAPEGGGNAQKPEGGPPPVNENNSADNSILLNENNSADNSILLNENNSADNSKEKEKENVNVKEKEKEKENTGQNSFFVSPHKNQEEEPAPEKPPGEKQPPEPPPDKPSRTKEDAGIVYEKARKLWNGLDIKPECRNLVMPRDYQDGCLATFQHYSWEEIENAVRNFAYHRKREGPEWKPPPLYGSLYGFLKTGVSKYFDDNACKELFKEDKNGPHR